MLPAVLFFLPAVSVSPTPSPAWPWEEKKERVNGVSKNSNLHGAKRAKKDEFYTQWPDIEKEVTAYLNYDPDVFRDKTLLLPCDDPEWSNFTKFFALRFREFGLKKLISTSLAPAATVQGHSRGKIFVLEREDDHTGDCGSTWSYLQGDGDFRSDEVKALRDEADMVITNPPFSLFREFLAWLSEGDVAFSIIGNTNTITYKEVYPLIKDNRLWLGATGNSNDMVFRVPAGAKVRDEDREKAARLGYPSTDTKVYTRLGNSCWFTNIQHGRRHEPLSLRTMADNVRFNKRIAGNPHAYTTYDNFDAIEVPATAGIPSDYTGVMGVPISFLDKYNPDQFEIVKFRHGNDGKDLRILQDNGKTKTPYFRVLIRHAGGGQLAAW